MTTTNDSWGGVICPGCDEEVFRILEGHCLPCLRRIESEAKDAEEKAKQVDEKNQKLMKQYHKWGLKVLPPKRKKAPKA